MHSFFSPTTLAFTHTQEDMLNFAILKSQHGTCSLHNLQRIWSGSQSSARHASCNVYIFVLTLKRLLAQYIAFKSPTIKWMYIHARLTHI